MNSQPRKNTGSSDKQKFVIGVDVGTKSARAGVFDLSGELLSHAQKEIELIKPKENFALYSADSIWAAVCKVVREARLEAGIEKESIAAIGFDATCSTVFRSASGAPVSVSPDLQPSLDTIAWLDHRAIEEAVEITQSNHEVLKYIGGVMSPEMATPKLLWVKRNLPDQWRKCGLIFDLSDYLVWRATGSTIRSTCTVTCKWTYLAHKDQPWRKDFFNYIQLDDFFEKTGVSTLTHSIGESAGQLSDEAARALDLSTDCKVSSGLIDAHAGALGVLGSLMGSAEDLNKSIAMISGTSTCHMALSESPRQVPGVWGPYLGAVAPGLWVNEGGQSVSGALLDHILLFHSQGENLGDNAHAKVTQRIRELLALEGDKFAERLHVLPDFHGNRSPLADAEAVGVISGLTLDNTFDSLARLYYATATAIALGTRHILSVVNEQGYEIENLYITGGHLKNPLLLELYADATGCNVIIPGETEGVLLGSAIGAASASGHFQTLAAAANAMAKPGRTIAPNPDRLAYFKRRFEVFLEMHIQRRKLDELIRKPKDTSRNQTSSPDRQLSRENRSTLH